MAPQTQSVKQVERVYYLSQMLFWLSVSLNLALSVLLIQARGIDLFQLGMLLSIYSVAVVVFEFPSGALADAIGRKLVSLLGFGLLLASHLVFLFAFSFPAFILFQVLNGIGRSFVSGALQAWFVDSLQAADPNVDIQPPLARAGVFELLALTFGTLAGSYIPKLFPGLPEDGTAVLTPLAVPIVFSMALKVVLVVVVALLVKEERVVTESEPRNKGLRQLPAVVREAFQVSRRNPVIPLLFGATLSSGFALAGLETFWQPRFENLLGGNEGNTLIFGVIMSGSFLVGMMGNMLSIPLSRVFKKRYALVAAVFQGVSGALLVLLALQSAVMPSIGLFWLVYMGLGVLVSPTMTLFNLEVPATRRSTMLSARSLVSYAGFFMGSLLLGYIAEHASIGTAWMVAGIVSVLGLWFYVWVDNRHPSQQQAADTPAR